MGQPEQALSLRAGFRALTGGDDPRRVRFTRTIVLEGSLSWIVQSVAKAALPRMGDHRTTTFGTFSCTEEKLEVLD